MAMKIDLTDLSPVKKTMTIEVDPGDVAQEAERTLDGYRRKARIPGFRPGKAPKSVIKNRFAKELEEDTRERILSRYFHEAVQEKGLTPIGNPQVEDLKHEGDGPFSFKTTFEVLPQIEPQGYKGVELQRAKPTVEDADVDKALEEIRESRVQHVVEEGREAGQGDVVIADVSGEPVESDEPAAKGDEADGDDAEGSEAGDSPAVEPFQRERVPIEIGAQNNLPAFNEHLTGLKAGAEVEFPVEYPADYGSEALRGKKMHFKLKVHEVKRRELPELDDEFAKDLGDFDDLAALRAKIREDLQGRKDHEEKQATRQAVLDKVLIANPVVLPDVLVENEIRRRLEDMVRSMMMQGMDPEKAALDWEDLRKRQEEHAKKMVHAKLILDAIAGIEDIEVSQREMDETLRGEAQRTGEEYDKLRERVRQHDGMKGLMDQLLREKSLDYLTSVANIQYSE
jgi:trigger factor